MPVKFENFTYSYLNGRKKPVYVPSDDGREIGLRVKTLVEKLHKFDPFYWHLRKGGHIGALHAHRDHDWFARIDLKNFFYSVRRQVIQRALRGCGVRRHEFFAKWSTVKNPYPEGGYVLPYGFVQSPILASLAMSVSPLGTYLREVADRVTVGVYLDDISISSYDHELLQVTFAGIVDRLPLSGFTLHPEKATAPATAIKLFNCDLHTGHSAVIESRRADFYAMPRSGFSVEGFESYCNSVELGNISIPP